RATGRGSSWCRAWRIAAAAMVPTRSTPSARSSSGAKRARHQRRSRPRTSGRVSRGRSARIRSTPNTREPATSRTPPTGRARLLDGLRPQGWGLEPWPLSCLDTHMAEPFVLAKTSKGADIVVLPKMGNRHGLITGATGTGKTVSLQVLADNFSRIGVPVFLADVKGDLSGVAAAGSATPKLQERMKAIGAQMPAFAANPVVFWDVFGKRGIPVRATISDLGPLLLGRLLDLNPTQQGVLTLVF